ncbi:MAG: hypothetical protein ACO1OK_05185 [Devosia sp.]
MKHDTEAYLQALSAHQLPDAPLAMPRQELERRLRWPSFGFMRVLLAFSAR